MVKKILICICLCLCSFALCYNSGYTRVFADTQVEEELPPVEDEEVIPDGTLTPEQQEIINGYESGYVISSSSHITDNNLYSMLLRFVREDIKEKHDIDYTGTVLYSDMFKSFTEIAINDNIINTLKGLDLIKFDNLKTLKVTNNKLTSITKDIFENMPVLESVDFSSNDIDSVQFGSIPTLTNITLNNNKLSSLDLSELGSTKVNLQVAQNLFEDMADIKFPNRVSEIDLNIINNNIEEIAEEYFRMEKLKLSIGVQGLSEKQFLDTSTPVRYYKTNTPNLTLKVFKYNGLLNEQVYEFKDEDIPANSYVLEKTFGIGEYSFEYYLNGVPAYAKNDSTLAFYKGGEMSVIPTVCTAKFEFKGKVYETFDNKVTGKVKVMLSSIDGGTIMYKVNSGDWQTGDTVMCDKGGNYTIYTKVVVDGIESEEKSFLIRTSQNVIIPDIVMLVLLLLFTFGLFFVLLPFISKKFFKK